MSAIAPGPLLDIEDVGDPVAVAQTNFEELTEAIYEFNPSKQNGVETTDIGPPTTGAHTLDECWRDAWNGEHRCTVAGTPGTWRQEKAAIRAGEPASGTIPTGYLIQDSSDSYRFKIHMGSYVWRPIAPNHFSHLTALTGGTTTALDGVATTSLAVGQIAQFIYSGKLHTFRLRAGTEAESYPWIVRPDDYATTTNEKVWELLDVTAYTTDRCYNELTGITGGTQLDLNSVPTVNMAVGRVVWFLHDGTLVAYKLVSDISATDSPTKIRPADFQSVTNPKVWWQILRVSAPGDLMIGSNNLSEIATSTTKRTASRTNLDVLWADDTRGLLEGRPARGGCFTDGVANSITGTAGLNFGLFDFSFSVVARLQDWTPTALVTLMATHSAGNNRVSLILDTAGAFRLGFVDSGGSVTYATMTPDVALVDETTYRVTVTVDRDGVATLYVNSVNDRDKSGSGPTADVTSYSALDIGSGNANTCVHIGSGLVGTFYEVLAFNYCLSSAQVTKLNAAGTAPFTDQWGNLTELITTQTNRDFSVSAGDWAAVGTGASVAHDAGNSELDVTVGNASTGARLSSTYAPTNTGKRYRTTFTIRNLSAGTVLLTLSGSNQSIQTGIGNGTVVAEYTVGSASTGINIIGTNAGATFTIDDVSHKQIGCLQALDLEHALPSQSTAIRDRSSNANHGTSVSSGFTQIRDAKQLNPSRLTVGAATVMQKLLSATAALNFGSIAAGATAELTITVTGAATGDSVSPGWPSTLEAGLVGIMYVSASNTVTVRLHNTTGSPIDPASQTFRATVLQFA